MPCLSTDRPAQRVHVSGRDVDADDSASSMVVRGRRDNAAAICCSGTSMAGRGTIATDPGRAASSVVEDELHAPSAVPDPRLDTGRPARDAFPVLPAMVSRHAGVGGVLGLLGGGEGRGERWW